MSRAARLLDLLELLRRHRAPIPGPALAEELGISIRTLYRDIATLQAQGADIQGEPGLGYVLRPGFTLPPLMFSADELEALVLGSRWVAVRGDARLAAAAGNAVAKLRAVLPDDLRANVDTATLTVPMFRSEPVAIDASVIRAAIRKEHRLVITYQDQNGESTTRTIWPLLIGFFDKVQVLAAWCELRQDYRAFRVDRIRSVEPKDERYPRRRTVLVQEWRARQVALAPAGN
ncbi:helix-turn-helix transcriptional regulator [Polyangium jinanense]|uniref:YafY family transcriptional regulator n=1 Tax=Polyangium jinanense TaxID=2829994 RepID=A0A9X3XAZ7_9BACT|nr:YafY family protein [Polyangium jinanense]MDC3960952.1 YafY family transcriptional regulator [Polyangium jinanense]MDC3987372.1 YafY family transcriptional regulator [Polyangium jinanense]